MESTPDPPYVGDDTYDAGGGQGCLLGFIYQLKLLMLFMERALRKGVAFRLATEVKAAGDFDDLVLECKNDGASDNESTYWFLQAKHSRNKSKKIDVTDLLSTKKFHLKKYFDSYCQIKRHPTFSKGKLEAFVIYTNIDLDEKKFESPDIGVILDDRRDDFLAIESKGEKSRRYKFSSTGPSKVYESLRSEASKLAQVMVEKVHTGKKLSNEIILVKYRSALMREVIDIGKRKLSDAFIEGKKLSEGAKNFRDAFYFQVLKQRRLPEDYNEPEKIWNEMKNKSLEFSQDFISGSKLKDVKKLSDEFETLLKSADDNKVVKIEMCQSKQDPRISEPIIERNLITLLKYVFTKGPQGKIRFRREFLNDDVKQPKGIFKLKQHLKSKLGDSFNDLDQYQFKISNLDARVKKEECSMDDFHDSYDNDKKIPYFLDRLILAVKQPNESQLDDVLKKEMGENYNLDLLRADLVTMSFEREMRYWFLEQRGSWLSNEKGLEFVNGVKNKIQTLIMSGLSLAYSEELENYGMVFRHENQELTDYLKLRETPEMNTTCNFVAPEGLLTAAIQVYRAIKSSRGFEGKYDCIIIRVTKLLLPGIRKHVIDAFKMQNRYNLLVVVSKRCNEKEYWELERLYNEDLHKIVMNVEYKMKRLIFVTSMELPFKNCYHVHCKLGFDDLTDESQRKLLDEQLVNLQDRKEKMSFAELLRIRPPENVESNDFKNFRDAMDLKMLEKLIRGDTRIGSSSESLDRIEDYFINRTFHPCVIIKVDVLNSEQTSEVYAVGHADHDSLRDLVMRQRRETFQRTDSSEGRQLRFVPLKSGEEQEQFEKLCKEYPRERHNVHWLMAGTKKLLWIRSNGSIDSLLEYRDFGENFDCDYRCSVCQTAASDAAIDELASQDGRPVIVCDIPGMGKSTVLTHLTRQMKTMNPKMWVIRINLNDYTDALLEESKRCTVKIGDKESVTEFLVNDFLKLDTIEKVVLKHLITVPSGLGLLFDGFDEISPRYTDTVIEILKAFKEYSGVKLVVTTRPHMRSTLERTLQAFSFPMKPFSRENQIDFLVKFWRNRCNEADEALLEERAKMVLGKIEDTISVRFDKFAGVPLQTLMIAEVFCPKVMKTASVVGHENMKPDVPDHITISDLYGMFVYRKYEIYLEITKKENLSNLAVQEDSEKLKKKSLKAYRRLAMYTLLKEEVPGTWTLCAKEVARVKELIAEISKGTDRIGIVTDVINQRAQFIHRTFLEYLVASYLFQKLEESNKDESSRQFKMYLLNEILVESRYKVIRVFLNDLLYKPPTVDSIFNVSICEVQLDSLTHGKYGENIFHIAADEGNYKIMEFFFSRLAKNFPEPRKVINLKSVDSGKTLMHKVVSKFPIHRFQSLSAETEKAVLTWLLEQNADVNITDGRGDTPMHTALRMKKSMVFKLLASQTNADKTARNRKKETLQHMAVASGDLNTLKWLVEDRGCDVDVRDKFGRTLQYVAARRGDLNMLKWLVEDRGCDLDVRDKSGMTLQHVAAERGDLNMLKWLVEDRGCDVDVRDKFGRTLQYVAAGRGDLDMLEWLVEDRGCDVGVRDKFGRTSQYVAAERGDLNMLKWLVEDRGCDVGVQDESGITLQHMAAMFGKLNILKWLVEDRGCDVDVRDESGMTLQHMAAMFGKLNILKWLVAQRGCYVDSRDISEVTLQQ